MTGDSDVSQIRRVLTLFAVLVIVGQATLVGAASAAPGENQPENCEGQFARSIVVVDWISPFDDVSQECWSRVSDNATASDLYKSALTNKDTQQSFTTTYTNLVNSSETYLRAEAKATGIRALRNGSNASEASAIVNETVDNVTSGMQINLIKAHNSTSRSVLYDAIAADQDGIDMFAANKYGGGPGGNHGWFVNFSSSDNSNYYTTRNKTVTLANGETRNATIFVTWYTGNSGEADYIWSHNSPFHTGTLNFSTGDTDVQEQDLAVHASDLPTEGSSPSYTTEADWTAEYVYSSSEWASEWQRVSNLNTRVKANAHTYLTELNSTYNQSQLQNMSLLGGLELAQEYNTNAETTGYYGWAGAELSLLGIGNNETSSFNISYTPNRTNATTETYNGALLTNWKPAKTNGSFLVNTTYNTSNASGPVFFAAQIDSGNASVLSLDGEFTINSLENTKTGEAVNSTTVDDSNITQTWNVSLTEEEFQRLLEQREDYTVAYQGGSGGGGGFNWGGLSLGGASIAALVAIAGILYAADRSSSAS